jgi:SAM-dependent methyltransferase
MWSSIYDEHWGEIFPTHRRMLTELLNLTPRPCYVLDAACGTGKYWEILLESGCSILGIDQAEKMLAQAKAKFPEVPTEKLGLQEMAFKGTFDAIICVDAMENVFPEDWPRVLANFQQALKSDGYLYFTVELADPQELEKVNAEAKQAGLPVVEGEWVRDGGYHYYPALEQVRKWVQASRLTLLKQTEGDEYAHFLVRNQAKG